MIPLGKAHTPDPSKLTPDEIDKSVNRLIADAIRSADWTFFNENYSKQAEEVVRALNQAGYVLLPRSPTKEMVTAGREAIEIGQHKPSAVAGEVYAAMVESGGVLP